MVALAGALQYCRHCAGVSDLVWIVLIAFFWRFDPQCHAPFAWVLSIAVVGGEISKQTQGAGPQVLRPPVL
jgi:hypothetical protein